MWICDSQHLSNEEVLRKVKASRNGIWKIRKKQLEFLHHVLWKDSMENVSITHFIDGKRSRGRQRIAFLDSLCKWAHG